MTGKTLISVIVPIYNVVNYLDNCIKSIVEQNYHALEIILVDDGSTDSSGDICDRWASKDKRIKVLHKNNGGLSSARNAGIDLAEGEWIRFVDGDDVIPENSLLLMTKAISDDVDIVSGSFERFVDSLPKTDGSHCREDIDILSGRQSLEMMLYQQTLSSSVCDKIFRRGLFATMRFKEDTLYEDIELMARILMVCNKVAIIPDVVYWYRKRPGSILSVPDLKRVCVLNVVDDIYGRIFLTGNVSLIKATCDRELSARFNIFQMLNKLGKGDSELADMCWLAIVYLRLTSLRNPKVRLKNKIGIILSYSGRKTFGYICRML